MSYLESSGTSSLVDETWVAWFCSLSGNHVFCEVDKQFIEDTFNLFGLKQYISKDFNKVLYTILDRYDQEEAETEDLSRAAALLYGLIHARYIITTSGLSAMHKKYMSREFGECPRAYCNGQAVLPIGVTDEPRLGTYKLFCPRCRDLFNCSQTQRRESHSAECRVYI
ncbi:casein kinase II, regulatory subunit [Ochromonadaceae sp. CCMP2298]|nr:casein kinase II, regulatory subunit [Ochromonadaceae sp. CCMP2298]